MKAYIKQSGKWTAALLALSFAWSSCSKDNPNDLPGTSAADYQGKIDGFDSSDQIYKANLVAYWSFDDTKAERFSGITPTATLNDSYVPGVRGKAINLANGWLYYGNQFAKFKTDSLKSWTVSEWINVLNNGSTPTMVFQLTRPNQIFGSINSMLETGQNPASELTKVIIKAIFADMNGGTQDNLNAPWLPTFKSPLTGPTKWINIVTTYDYVANNLQIWADGVMIGTTDYQNRGSNYFKAFEPSTVIIGGWQRNVGTMTNPDTWQVPMNGKVDEIRVFNTVLGSAHIRALYNLGVAGK
ncbi:MAG: hypothetical protein JWQ27_2112 [Ferruginibacter sp.]|nr:hypothetical protein [Ferruginibacter sp.]